jgi:hypothetical protein
MANDITPEIISGLNDGDVGLPPLTTAWGRFFGFYPWMGSVARPTPGP